MKITFIFMGLLQAKHFSVEGNYIVKLKQRPEVRGFFNPLTRIQSLLRLASAPFQQVKSFSRLGSVYSMELDENKAESLRNQPDVEYVEKDFVVQVERLQTVQKDAPWHLSRISHPEPLPPSQYTYEYESAGEGITVYVLDSGIFVNHPEFEGRARHGKTFFGQGDQDGTGHGTFVAGLIGSKTYGVAKKVNLVSVKVFDVQGRSTGSSTIEAIEWVIENAVPGRSIMNLSLGSEKSQALNDAVNAAVQANIAVVVAAGNQNVDACTRSPASSNSVITVGSVGISDQRSSFSNYGRCVDIFAPGERLPSTSNKGGVSLATGTSATTPIVAGIAAIFLSNDTSLSALDVNRKLLHASTKNHLSSLNPFSPNRLAYTKINDKL